MTITTFPPGTTDLEMVLHRLTAIEEKIDAILAVHQYVQDQIEEIRPKVEPTLKMIDDFKTSTVGKMLTGG